MKNYKHSVKSGNAMKLAAVASAAIMMAPVALNSVTSFADTSKDASLDAQAKAQADQKAAAKAAKGTDNSTSNSTTSAYKYPSTVTATSDKLNVTAVTSAESQLTGLFKTVETKINALPAADQAKIWAASPAYDGGTNYMQAYVQAYEMAHNVTVADPNLGDGEAALGVYANGEWYSKDYSSRTYSNKIGYIVGGTSYDASGAAVKNVGILNVLTDLNATLDKYITTAEQALTTEIAQANNVYKAAGSTLQATPAAKTFKAQIASAQATLANKSASDAQLTAAKNALDKAIVAFTPAAVKQSKTDEFKAEQAKKAAGVKAAADKLAAAQAKLARTQTGVAHINYAKGYGIQIWTKDHKLVKEDGVAKKAKGQMNYKVFGSVRNINGKLYYCLGGNQFVDADYVTVTFNLAK